MRSDERQGRLPRLRERRESREAEGHARLAAFLGLLLCRGLDLLDQRCGEGVEGADLVERQREDLTLWGFDLKDRALDGHGEGPLLGGARDAAGEERVHRADRDALAEAGDDGEPAVEEILLVGRALVVASPHDGEVREQLADDVVPEELARDGEVAQAVAGGRCRWRGRAGSSDLLAHDAIVPDAGSLWTPRSREAPNSPGSK